MPSIFWFRRDLRLRDNPGLLAAANESRSLGDGEVVPLFVLDPRLWASAGPVRQAYLVASLASLDASLGGSLLIRHGDPLTCVPAVAAASNASSVHVAADFGPYGQERDFAVDRALGDVPFIRTGSAYAVAPGRVRKDDGTPYRVYTPFYRAWLRHRWPAPAAGLPPELRWSMPLDCHGFPDSPDLGQLVLPPAGEQAAWAQWERFRAGGLSTYAELRNRPDLAGTSALGHHLKWGELHPRSLLAELTEEEEVFRKELCWREFYADVLYQRPDSARTSLDARFDDAMAWAQDDRSAFEAWATGHTGYPFVDAGMRQLRSEGWMHNRVRMVVASFLVKDLHIPWQRGAAEFMHWLRDGDLASNAHGWQWTAGCGTDASPFYRVFNPVLQGLKFDPEGDYVRRYVPELRHLPGKRAHEPWNETGLGGYAERVVTHATERSIALANYALIKASNA